MRQLDQIPRSLGRISGLLAFTASSALGLGMLGTPFAHAATPAPAASTAPATAPSTAPALTPLQKALADARAKAKATGKPVVVDELTTETSQTQLNPDGTLSTDDHARPVRTKRGQTWTDLDATLHRNADRTLSPAVTATGLTLSGGGTGPLASLTTADGKKLAVSTPFTLPAPSLAGATATYADVLPDVDLQVTALPAGGWRDVIVVRTAAAAADPQLKKLHFPLKAEGLSVSTDAAGNVNLKDAAGKVRMHAPTPFQWDSALPVPAAPGAKPAAKATSLLANPYAPAVAPSGLSTAEAPGEQAHQAPIGIKATDSGFDLTPDPATFGKGTGPWYLDPTVSADGGYQASDQVQEYNAGTKYYNSVSDLGTGYCGYSDCTGYGRERAYFQVGVNPVLYTTPGGAAGPPTIYGSTLYAQVSGASSPGTSTPLGVYDTGTINSDTTWNNQPCGYGAMDGCTKVDTSWITGTGPITFNVTSIMQTAVSRRWGNWTFAIVPDDESNKYYRHHITNNPHVTTNYDIAPTIWNPRTTPAPGFASNGSTNTCPGSSNPGWLGSNQTLTMTSATWSPIGANLTTWYHLWDVASGGYSTNPNTGQLGSYGDAPMQVYATSLSDGHTYQWESQNSDGTLSSGVTGRCYFRVDTTPPTVSLGSTDFPPTGTLGAIPKLKAGQTGTFTLGGTDPAPAGGSASGVACFRWSDNPTPVTGWKCTDASSTGTGIVPAGTSQFTYKPVQWGTHVLYVQSQDNAGNYSQPLPYSFYAPWDPANVAVPGNVTGDGRPDLLQPDGSGNLRSIPIGKDPITAQAAPMGAVPQDGPTPNTWNDVQTTHRGTLRAWSVDDVFARITKTTTLAAQLFLYQNDGKGTLTTRSTINRATTWADATTGTEIPAPADYAADWSKTTQMLALGALKAPLNPANESDMTKTATSLLTVENGNLWLHRSYGINQFDADAVEVSKTGTWGNYDLIAPGSASGYAQPTLWTRNRTNGDIRAYVIKTTAAGTLDLSGLADPAGGTQIGGGVTVAAFPTVGSTGDLGTDGLADLWAIDSNQHLISWPGVAGDSTHPSVVTTFGDHLDLGDMRTPNAHWRLADPAGSATAADSTGAFPLTVQGGATFGTDTVNGKAANVAAFNGSSSAMVAGGPVVLDTTKSFTVSLWAKATASGGVTISQDGTNASGFQLWPSNRGGGIVEWRLGMAASDTANAVIDQTDTRNANDLVTYGSWAQLTASYNAATGELLLYVNGALASTGLHHGGFKATGPLVLGRFKQNGAPAAFFNGSLAEVSVYPWATSPTTNGATSLQVGTTPVKCMDNNNAVLTNGNPVQIWDCFPGINAQSWSLNADGTITTQGHCLDVNNGTPADGTIVQVWGCSAGNPNQQWLPTGTGALYNPASGRCLDDANSSVSNGTRLAVWTCNGGPNQQWSFAAYTPVPVASQPWTS